ncbi:hypothetical protein CPB86DRAFT_786156 [Serendipita vermifera]|nr:hypothetical protein CPB86DRAFT_786156 [Serendipita vermifera]
MLIGDRGVGRYSLSKRYIYGLPYYGNDWEVLSQSNDDWREFSLTSSPILPNGQSLRPTGFLATLRRALKNKPETIELIFWFTKMKESEFQASPLSASTTDEFARTDVVAICYDCSRQETLHNTIYKWHPIVLHHGPNIPVFLVGCRSDLKPIDPNDTSIQFVTTEEAKKAAHQIGAVDALECSSDNGESIDKVGDLLVWYACYSHFGVNGGPLTPWERLKSFL